MKRELTGEKEKRIIDKIRELFRGKVEKLRKKLGRGKNVAVKGTIGATVEAKKEPADDQK